MSPEVFRTKVQPSGWRLIHRRLGISLALFFLLAAGTGFLRANASWYWEPGHKQRTHGAACLQTPPAVGIPEVFSLLRKRLGDDVRVEQVLLRRELGRSLYMAQLQQPAGGAVLIDGATGEVLSPLSEELAREMARQYVPDDWVVRSVSLVEAYKPRKAKRAAPAYRVEFGDGRHTAIYLDPDSGVIVDELDDLRRFGVWIARLHEWDFGELKRPLLSVTGAGFITLGFSGLWLWKVTRRKGGGTP